MVEKYFMMVGGGLAVVWGISFLIGTLVGKLARSMDRALIAAPAVVILLMVGMVLGLKYLDGRGISGRLISVQVLALWMEVSLALLSGAITACAGKPRQRRPMIAANVLAFLSLVAVGVQLWNLKPVFDVLEELGILKQKDNYQPETNKDCPANLQSLYNAFEQYAELNDSLPAAENWQDNGDLTSRIPQDEWMHCPVVSNRHDDKFGYAYNSTLGGKKLNLKGSPLKSLPNAATTPLLYDSTDLHKNAHDAFSSLPKPGRHSGRDNVLYLDGHVAAVKPK